MKDDYRDLLHLPHHRSPAHAPMPRQSRAAQFAPFAALTGFDAQLRETERQTRLLSCWTRLQMPSRKNTA